MSCPLTFSSAFYPSLFLPVSFDPRFMKHWRCLHAHQYPGSSFSEYAVWRSLDQLSGALWETPWNLWHVKTSFKFLKPHIVAKMVGKHMGTDLQGHGQKPGYWYDHMWCEQPDFSSWNQTKIHIQATDAQRNSASLIDQRCSDRMDNKPTKREIQYDVHTIVKNPILQY